MATRKKTPVTSHKSLATIIDRHFADLVQNVPELRQTDNHNALIKARESLKTALITKKEA